MSFTIHPISEGFGAEITDIDLSKPLPTADLEAVKQAFWKYAVLVFVDQKLSTQQHLDFAENFGPHETSILEYRDDTPMRTNASIADVSNILAGDEIWEKDNRLREFQLGNRLWHTDSSFKYLPALASALYAREIPPVGGNTEFADVRAAYDDLPEAMKAKLEGLVAQHSIFNSRARLGFDKFDAKERKNLPPVPQMLVRSIPQTDRKNLYIASHAARIIGMPDDAAAALIDELLAHATQAKYVYSHRWRVNDLVMWDDRCTLHRGTEFDDLRYRRDVQRATVSDIANTCEQAGLDGAELKQKVA
jgi:alpha-ketoglutarate-dependent 2,4-dichlorophenoxyacetate dioxygenase